MIFGLFGGDKKRVAELIAAARSGDTVKIEQLLSKGADVNAAEPESGDTPILAAVDKSQAEAVALLLKHHADLSIQDKNGNSPLYIAVGRGDVALPIVNMLLEAGARPELGPSHGDNAGFTPVHVACATAGANGCLESLLQHGASATTPLPNGATPMHTSALGGDQKTVELLHKAGASVNALKHDQRTPLHNAGITGNAKVAAALIALGAEVNPVDKDGWTPVLYAAYKNHTEVAKVLLDSGANPDVIARSAGTSVYPLYFAAMDGFDDMIRLLVEKGANVAIKVEGCHPLVDVAKFKGHESAAKLLGAALKQQSASANADKAVAKLWRDLVTALNSAVVADIKRLAKAPQLSKLSLDQQLIVQSVLGDTERVRELLSAGANPNAAIAAVFFGAPVLYVSAGSEGSTDVVALLLDAGADPHLTQEDGSTALHVAAKRGNVRIAKLLMEKGANPNATYTNGLPPLIDASIQGNTRMVDALIDGGADINAVAELGFCAFAAAIDNRRMKLAEHLLERGANPNFGDVETLPLAVAEHGSLSLIRAIESRGGSIVRPDMLARVAFVAARNKDGEVLDHVLNNGADPCHGNDLNYSPLILASLANHPKLVEQYLTRGDDASHLDVDLETALSLAIEKQHSEVIAILRQHDSQVVDYPGLSQPEAMLQASSDGALGTILNLHDDGISVNTEDAVGNSALILAARNGHVGVVRTLYHLGADINHKNSEGLSASNLAKTAGHEKVLKTLMELYASGVTRDLYGFDDKDGERTFDAFDALSGRHTHPFKDVFPYDAKEDSSDENDEDDELGDGDTQDESEGSGSIVSEEVAQMLSKFEELLEKPHIIKKMSAENREVITARIKLVWAHGESAIPRAQLDELTEVCKILADQPETEEAELPLFEAVSEGNLKALRKLIKGGASIDDALPDGTTLLMVAVQNGHDSIVKELITLGVDVNQRQSESFTALIFATFQGNENIVKLLLANGADINMGHSLPSSQGASGGQTALTVASGRKNLSMCKLLIKLGADINVVTESGYSALMWSLAGTDDGACAKQLLQAGADPDPDAVPAVSFATLTSPLVLSATNGATDIVKELIRRKVRLDKPDGDGCTALKRAANSGHVDVVAALVKAGASVNVADHDGWTALMNAAGHGQLEICRILIKAGADVKAVANSGVTALSQATGTRADGRALNALKDLKRVLGQEDDDEGDGDAEPNDLATDSFKLVRILLKDGANPNVKRDGKPLLEHAMKDGDEDLVKLLKEHGANAAEPETDLDHDETEEEDESELEHEHVSDEKGEALLDAVLDCSVKPIAAILDDGANIDYVNAAGKTALTVAVYGLNEVGMPRQMRRNLLEVADYLLRRGAGVNVPGCDPTPLGWAACAGEIYLVKAMLKRGADPEARLSGRTTALLTALAEKREGCALALIEADANMQTRSLGGQTALHIAAAKGLARVVDACLARLPDLVNTVDDNADTPLMLAATKGHESIVKSLLRFNADTTMTDSDGRTAADQARKNGHNELATLLG